jgi:hypothetical protein
MRARTFRHTPNLDRGLFVCGACFLLIVPIGIDLHYHDVAAAWLAAMCGGFVIFSSRLDALALPPDPVRATIRDTMAEAAATVDELRELATSMIAAFLTDLIGGSFMGAVSLEKRLQLHDELLEKLKALGLKNDQLRNVDEDWRKGISIVFHRIITRHISDAADPSDRAAHNQLHSEMQSLLDFSNWTVASPSAYEDFARKNQALTSNVQSWIADYRHFLTSNEIRRRDEFVKG